jgi:serine/threonine-protein phosphatase PPG1
VIDRFKEIPHEGGMADLVWSDPDPERDEFTISQRYIFSRCGSKCRGAGYQFGAQIVEKFLHVNNMRHILRAHQLCNEGYQVLFNNRLSTVWSAPNYCYRCGNRASICEVSDSGSMSFNVFDESPENEIVVKEQQQQNKVIILCQMVNSQ